MPLASLEAPGSADGPRRRYPADKRGLSFPEFLDATGVAQEIQALLLELYKEPIRPEAPDDVKRWVEERCAPGLAAPRRSVLHFGWFGPYSGCFHGNAVLVAGLLNL